MATPLDFIEYVCDQIDGAGAVRYRKMFGDYMIYVNDKLILLVCDSTVYVKILPCLDGLMSGAEKGFPYTSTKEHYIVDTDNTELLTAVIGVLEPVTPFPKPKKKKPQAK